MEDTICAIATSLGVGAISIIRLSGKDSINIVNKIFSRDLTKCKSHTITYGFIMDGKEKVDEVLVMLMKAPKTYTTEDVVEINCHGGFNTTNKVLELLLKNGARLAEGGEFTKRAFLGGRINLLQSEAVNELIKAQSDSQRKLSLNQIGGNLTKKIDNIRQMLLSLMANIEVNIDYPEYVDNLVITNNLLDEKLHEIKKTLTKLVEGSKYGKIAQNGINVAIVGKPNVGKSSILNHLLDEQKAIVTDIAGTTRDIVEGTLSLEGIAVHLIDTAGIHETDDIVEKIGVNKSKDVIYSSDVVLLVIDGSSPLTNDDYNLLSMIPKEKLLVFINKSDLNLKVDKEFAKVVYGNTVTLEGLDNLKQELIKMFNIKEINKDLTYLSNARQISLAQKAKDILERALSSLNNSIPIDMIENDLKECYVTLGEIIGDSYEEDVINELFKNFCVGK